MSKCKVRPRATKEQAHDLRTEADVFLPLRALDVAARKIPQIMQEECCPKAGIPGKAPSDPPSDRDEEGVYEEAGSHRELHLLIDAKRRVSKSRIRFTPYRAAVLR